MDLSRFPRVSLAHLPTPLEPLERLRAHLGGPAAELAGALAQRRAQVLSQGHRPEGAGGVAPQLAAERRGGGSADRSVGSLA